MSTEAALLHAIREHPEEDTPRLAFADYLDELGGAANVARAEFIRLQIRLTTLDETHSERPALEDRENELLRKYERAWLGKLSAPLAGGLDRWRFERGFVGKIRIDTRTLCNCGDDLFERHPISRVRLRPVDMNEPGPVSKLSKKQWWSRVRELRLCDFSAPSVHTCEPLVTSSRLTGLKRLAILAYDDNESSPKMPSVLARCPSLAGLEELRISDWPYDSTKLIPVLKDSAVRTLVLRDCTFTVNGLAKLLSSDFGDRPMRVELADGNLSADLWPALARKNVKPILRRLDLSYGDSSDPDLPTLLSSPGAANLNALDLSETTLAGTKVRVLATSGFMARATEIGLTRCRVYAKVITTLAKADAPLLRKLELGETGLRNAGVFALCKAEWTNNLTYLDIMRNYLDDDALIAMARSGRFVNVRYLDLRVNSPDLGSDCRGAIGDKGVTALAEAPNFARLRHLNLYLTRVGARGIDAILNSPHCRISSLELGGYRLGADVVKVLAKSPGLARLTKLGLSFTPSLGGDKLMPLAESPYLSPLCHLSVRYNNTSDKVRARLVERLGRRLEDTAA